MKQRTSYLSVAVRQWVSSAGVRGLLGCLLVGCGVIVVSIASAAHGAEPVSETFAPIYFSRDSFGLNESGLAVVRRHATYLESHPEVQVLLKGHTTREGTLAYELVLGEKRAQAVRRALMQLGVAPARLHLKSVGRGEAVCWARTEACRRQNRRVTLERVEVPVPETRH